MLRWYRFARTTYRFLPPSASSSPYAIDELFYKYPVKRLWNICERTTTSGTQRILFPHLPQGGSMWCHRQARAEFRQIPSTSNDHPSPQQPSTIFPIAPCNSANIFPPATSVSLCTRTGLNCSPRNGNEIPDHDFGMPSFVGRSRVEIPRRRHSSTFKRSM